jgi:hypothetical protein
MSAGHANCISHQGTRGHFTTRQSRLRTGSNYYVKARKDDFDGRSRTADGAEHKLSVSYDGCCLAPDIGAGFVSADNQRRADWSIRAGRRRVSVA